MTASNYQIKEMQPAEYPLLDEFLYQAIFLPEGVEPPPREIILQPDLQVYVQTFGAGAWDTALCAEADGQIVGAVWVRIMHDYGHIDDETPSLAISLLPEYRGRGIGTALLHAMLGKLRKMKCPAVSLSVQTANFALHMYEQAGFETVRMQNGEAIMRCTLCKSDTQ